MYKIAKKLILQKKFSAAVRPSWASRSAAAIRGRKKPFANRIREFDTQRGLKRIKTEFILTKRISENLPPNPGRTRAEAGRQNFERSAAAIRGRKKPFANRIRELNVYCDLKTMKKFALIKNPDAIG